MVGPRLVGWTSLIALAAACAHAAAQAQFVPGHFYTPLDGGTVVEWDGSLNEVRRFNVGGVVAATGATFNGSGNLVFLGLRADRLRVMEVDANGNILDEYNTGRGSGQRGASIDYDGLGRRYVFADDDYVTLLDDNLEYLGSTAGLFDRSSGVTFRQDGGFYALDQWTRLLSSFDSEGRLLRQDNVGGNINTGMDIAPNGDVYFVSYGDQVVRRFDPDTGQTVIAKSDGFGHDDISDLKILPDGRFLVTALTGPSFLFDQQWNPIAQSDHFGGVGDSMAYFVPTPGTLAVLGCSLLACRRRRLDRHPTEGWICISTPKG